MEFRLCPCTGGGQSNPLFDKRIYRFLDQSNSLASPKFVRTTGRGVGALLVRHCRGGNRHCLEWGGPPCRGFQAITCRCSCSRLSFGSHLKTNIKRLSVSDNLIRTVVKYRGIENGNKITECSWELETVKKVAIQNF